MSERMSGLRTLGTGAFLSMIAISGCSGGYESSEPPFNVSSYLQTNDEKPTSIEDALKQGNDALLCIQQNNPNLDCDNDTVPNGSDLRPGRNDLADDDGDLVRNAYDKYEGFDDKTFDTDGDTIPDYLDTFFGNNAGDQDGDGLTNGFDPQPYVAPPSGVAKQPPQYLSETELMNALVLMQAGRKYTQELYDRPDSDFDGIPDAVDTRPDAYTNDRDNDGDPDYYDPKPNDYYTDSKNDPYDPRNDEYWEK